MKSICDHLNLIPMAYFSTTIDGQIIEVNSEVIKLLGFPKEELIGRNILEFYGATPDAREQGLAFYAQVQSGTEVGRQEVRMRKADGTMVWVNLTILLVKDEQGRPVAFRQLVEDITERKKTEEALRKSQQAYEIFVNSIEGIVWECEFPSYQFTFVSQQAERLLGYPVQKWAEPEFFKNHLHAEDRDWMLKICAEMTWLKKDHELEYRMVAADNRVVWLRDLITVVVENDQPVKVRGVMVDITQQKESDKNLEEARKFTDSIVENLPNMIMVKDAQNLRFVRCNKAAENLLGYAREDMLGRTDYDLFPKEEADFFTSNDRTVLEKGVLLDIPEEAIQTRDRGGRTLHTKKIPLVDDQGEPQYLLGISEDITDRKRAEERLRLTQFFLDHAADDFFLVGPDGQFLDVNDAACRSLGYSREELLTMKVSDIAPVLFKNDWLATWNFIKEKGMFTFESLHKAKNGRIFPVEVTVTYLNFEGKEYEVAFVWDITEPKKATQRLLTISEGVSSHIGEEFFRSFVEHLSKALEVDYALIGQVMEDQSGRVRTLAVWGEGRLLQNFDYDPAGTPCGEVVGKRYCVYPEGVQELFPSVTLLGDLGIKGYAGTPLFDAQGKPLGLIVVLHREELQNLPEVESTLKIFGARAVAELERHRAETALRFTQFAVDKAGDAAFWILPNGRFCYVNEAACRSLGYSKAELLDLSVPDIVPDFPQDKFEGIWQKIKENELSTFESRHRTKQGRVFSVEVTARFVGFQGQEYICSFARDISERKRLEEAVRRHNEELESEVERRSGQIQQLEQRRMQVEKLAALAQVAAGVAHEINNPLASISQSLLLVKRGYPTEHPRYEYLGKIEDAIERIAHIIRQLYQLYTPSPTSAEPLSVTPLVQDALDIMASQASKQGVNITEDLLPEISPVRVSKPELIQVLCNLIQNALDVSSPGKEVKVTLEPWNGDIALSVWDQGPGIDQEVASRMFDPFFTTKSGSTKKGMGLGLAVSRSLVESMGGTIEVNTKVGEGSRFTVVLPKGR